MKTYDRVKTILERIPQTRNSDKHLIWKFWESEEQIPWEGDSISYSDFMKATSSESICRARRMIQAKFPDLQPTSEKVRKQRGIKEATKGTYIFREDTGQGVFA